MLRWISLPTPDLCQLKHSKSFTGSARKTKVRDQFTVTHVQRKEEKKTTVCLISFLLSFLLFIMPSPSLSAAFLPLFIPLLNPLFTISLSNLFSQLHHSLSHCTPYLTSLLPPPCLCGSLFLF